MNRPGASLPSLRHPPPSMSYEQAVQHLRAQPRWATLLRDSYLDDDPALAARRFAGSEEFRATLELVSAAGARTGRLMDLGAGNGIASYAFAQAGLRVVSVEPGNGRTVGAAAIARVRDLGVAIAPCRAAGEALPFADGAFQIAYARQVLHHARDLGRMLQEVARVTSRGGFLLAAREHVVDDQEQLDQFLAAHPLQPLHGGESAFPLTTYLAALQAAGFAVVKTLGPWDSPLNYAPLDDEALGELARRWATRRLGAVLARSVPGVLWKKLYLARQRATECSPGRLYSFLARRS